MVIKLFDILTCYISAILTAAKESNPLEVALRFNSLTPNVSCAVPAQLPATDVKSTRCEVASGVPICCGGAQWVGGSSFDVCWYYSYVTDSWTQYVGATMQEPRSNGFAIELNDGTLWYTGKF